MAKLSFRWLLQFVMVVCYLVPLLQLNSLEQVVLQRRKDGPSLVPRWTCSSFFIRETQVPFAKDLESLSLSAHRRQQQAGILQRMSNRFMLGL